MKAFVIPVNKYIETNS